MNEKTHNRLNICGRYILMKSNTYKLGIEGKLNLINGAHRNDTNVTHIKDKVIGPPSSQH